MCCVPVADVATEEQAAEPDAVEEKQDGGDVAAVYDGPVEGGDVAAVYDGPAEGGDAPTLPDGVMTINAPASEETAGGWVVGIWFMAQQH